MVNLISPGTAHILEPIAHCEQMRHKISRPGRGAAEFSAGRLLISRSIHWAVSESR
jgi:hypothetical protein